MEMEKQAQEINAKAEEISVSRQMYEDLKLSFGEKESVLRQLTSANEKLRTDYGERVRKLEGENKDLAVALDGATLKSEDQEQKIEMYKKEIESLKGRLTILQKKCSEAEESSRELKELRQRDDMVSNVEEDNRKFKDELKWKTEQFKHLEEAHDKLQNQFRLSTMEWEKEKSTLVDEISSLQTSLDSQTRISESLQNRLQMCNQALAHEESRRKLLEVQMSDSKASYENVFSEYQEAKSKIESLTVRRDEEIASLRNSLGTKQTFSKEMEYRIGHLEQENQELRRSLKEFQEAQIHEAGAASSLSKLRNKLRVLEQAHKECSVNLKARETEWSFQLEKRTGDLNECRVKLACKDEKIQELQMELEGCHSSVLQLKLDYEEVSVLLMVFRTGFSDAQSSLSSLKIEMELLRQEKEDQIALLMEQLEQKNSAFLKAYHELEHAQEITASLDMHIEPSDEIEKQLSEMQKELERYKEMLEQSSGEQLRLEEEASEMENALKEELRKVSDALYIATSELAERTQEENEMEFELARRRSLTERLKSSLKENHETRREIEASILAQVETELTIKLENECLLHALETKDKMVDDLQKQIDCFEQEKERFLQALEEKEKIICTFQQQIACLEQECMTRELEAAILARTKEEKTSEQEKERLHLVVEEKEQVIEKLQTQTKLLEQGFTRSVEASVRSGLAEKQSEINMLCEAWEKMVTARVLGELEIEEKNVIMAELEEETHILQQKLELQKESSCHLKQRAEHLEQGFTRSVEASVHSGLAEKQSEINILHEAWEKMVMARVLGELEIQEKNVIMAELEEETHILQQKLELQEESLCHLKQQAEHLKAVLEAKQLETESIRDQLGNNKRTSEGVIEELESEKRLLHESILKLSSERNDLVEQIGRFCDQISEVSDEETQLIGRLGLIVQSIDKENKMMTNLDGENEIYDLNIENLMTPLFSSVKKTEASPGRSPLRDRNVWPLLGSLFSHISCIQDESSYFRFETWIPLLIWNTIFLVICYIQFIVQFVKNKFSELLIKTIRVPI